MKIAVLTSSFPRYPGDHQGNFVYYLARGQEERGNDVQVICPHIPGTAFHETTDGVRVHRFPYFYPYHLQNLSSDTGMDSALSNSLLAWLQLPLFFLCQWFMAYRIIRKQNIDIIHSHWIIPQGLAGVFLHIFTGIPHIASIHGSDLNILKRYTILHPVCRFITRHTTIITVNSSYMKQQLLVISPGCEEKIRVIPMGIEPAQYGTGSLRDMKKSHGASHLILSVGRLIDWKGTEYLIRAMPAVLEKYPGAQLLIAGIGPERDNLIQLAGRLGLDNRVFFLGLVPAEDLPSYYRSADVFVLPSINKDGKTEGLGVVLLEAMASGCPVIGSNVGGIPDIITDGENGFLVPERDPAALAEKIVTVLSDADVRERFRQNSYKRIQDSFSWERISEQFFGVYSAVQKKRKNRYEHAQSLLM